MIIESISSLCNANIQPNVRCLVGLYGTSKSNVSEELEDLLEEKDDEDILKYAMEHEDSDDVRFLVGSQILKSHSGEITLITITEALDIDVKKQTFSHPDGEIIGLCVLPSQPDWFISIYSNCSSKTELKTGARVWRLPNLNDSISDDYLEYFNDEPVSKCDNSMKNTLDYITTLPLDENCGIKKIISNPSTANSDLACIVTSSTNSINSGATAKSLLGTLGNYLVILKAPGESGSGSDYQVASNVRLCLPSPPTTLPSNGTKKSYTNFLSATSSSTAVCWSPHEQASQLAIAFETGILGWDVRSMEPCFWLENAHWPCVRDLDYNPHRANVLVSGGDDGCLRLWDLRYLKSRNQCAPVPAAAPGGADGFQKHVSNSPASGRQNVASSQRAFQYGCDKLVEPLYAIQSHSHWIWSVRYHPTRDQLILSSGSDGCVYLYSLLNFSSDALNIGSSPSTGLSHPVPDEPNVEHSTGVDQMSELKLDYEEEHVATKDGLIGKFEHEESVYAVDWSPVDGWYFSSVSYDGNLMIHRVPESVKLNILLQSKDY